MARRSHRGAYKRIPLIPGFLYLNVSLNGISFSVGNSSARMTAGNRGVRVGGKIPGTGVRLSKSFGTSIIKSLFGGGKKR